MATQPHTLITAEQFYQLPQEEGREFELLDGEVIEMPSATGYHNMIVSRLTGFVFPALRGRGEAIYETDFSDGRRTTLRPDLAILFREKLAATDLHKLPITVPPDIVVEVISPSESGMRIERRKDAYLRFGVKEVWIVYPENQHTYLHSDAGVTRLRSGDALASPLLPGWSVEVDQIFES
jgi:Uma2 family endonuclease